ncbi:MAG TPA: TIGR03084 family metal-binding protein [Acidimicrobiales bacterium]|nr:TIGR03084 family metal-binding protein [Acidimicrobiales bacterium]
MSAPDLSSLCADAEAEHADVAAMVAGLAPAAWATPTPAPGWDIRDQVGHLAFFDYAAALAIRDPQAFARMQAGAEADADFVEGVRARWVDRSGPEVLEWWAAERASFLAAVLASDPALRVPWFGPPMSLASKVTARIMETWAHGQDVADALGRTRAATDRLRHVAHIGVRARPFSYLARGREMPAADVAVELRAPSGATWSWEEAGSADRVEGTGLDFCLVVTQRRHLDDTDLSATPGPAREWMEIAQAFAGPPGPGRRPGQFARRPEEEIR